MVENKSINAQKNIDAKDEIDVGRLYGAILDHRWLIAGVTLFFTLIGLVYSIFATPIYSANALIQVESSPGNLVASQVASSLIPDAKPESNAEVELIQSRMVLGKTINDLGLDSVISPKYFPVFGSGWARLMGTKVPQLAVTRFNVPTELMGKKIVLTVGDNKTFKLSYDGDEILNGRVGQYEKNGEISILVSDADAENGQEFYIQKIPYINTYNALLANLTVEDKNKDSGVLTLTLNGPDPKMTEKTLQNIANNYLFQNVERKSEEAQRSLNFVDKQMPEVRQNLDIAEGKLNKFRQANDSVDLSLEAKSLLDTMVNVDQQLNELTFREAEISKLYTKEHPAYRTLLEKRQTLLDEKKNLEGKVSGLPNTQQEIIRLSRDVDAGQAVFMQLLNKQQELSINKASTVGNVRIVDPALVLYKPISPKVAIIIIVSFLVGLIFSIIYVVMKAILVRGIESPEQLENNGISVYASIPLSEWQRDRDRILYQQNRIKNKNKPVKSSELLAVANPADLSIEAIRSLRTTMHFAMLDAKNNIVMISGTSPDIGKTFVSTNLATVMAQSGQRVMIIDGDMRKGYAHDLFNKSNTKGISELLSNQAEISDIIQKTDIENLDFISRGQVPPNPSELLMNRRFTEMLGELQDDYDIVIIDTPPILAVTDAAVIGMHVGTTLLVTGFERTTVKEVEVSIRRFSQSGIDVKGVILNLVMKKSAGYYGYGYYHYSYESTGKA
nr:polysaccharide biosynthesis tyrosine autokinase [Pantoea sp. 201603H]